MPNNTLLRETELAQLSADFERAPAKRIIEWAVDAFGPHLALSASMTNAVLVDLAVKADPAIEIIFIDTGYHFDETLQTMERVRRRYGLNLRLMTVAPQPVPLWELDPQSCCSAAKVEQLDRALASKQAWMSGLRRNEAATRQDSPIVSRDRRGLVKINPLATWTDQDVDEYITANDIIVNPLIAQGYLSVGCAPCTTPVAPGEDPRAGRWRGQEKTECGLHID